MKRLVLGIVLCLAVSPHAGRAAGISVASLLPSGSRLLLQTRVAGYRHAVAVGYRSGHPYVGIALVGTPHDRLIWSSRLTATPRRLLSPEPTGAVVVYAAAEGKPGAVSAFRLHAGHVSWALPPGKGRPLPASSLKVNGRTATVASPDAAHIGSVAYQYLTTLKWNRSRYVVTATVHEPVMSPAKYPRPNGVVHLKDGDTVLMKLETAWTLAQQEHGLMDRPSLDPDSGMVFIWPGLVGLTFTMSNTLIPLTIAFLAPDGTILFTQDMTPLDSATPYGPDISHCATRVPGQCYQFAIEMNKGFYTRSGIQVGDKVTLTLPCTSFQGFHSVSVKCYS